MLYISYHHNSNKEEIVLHHFEDLAIAKIRDQNSNYTNLTKLKMQYNIGELLTNEPYCYTLKLIVIDR